MRSPALLNEPEYSPAIRSPGPYRVSKAWRSLTTSTYSVGPIGVSMKVKSMPSERRTRFRLTISLPMLVSSMILRVGIVGIATVLRMVHDLADPQARGDRPDGKDRLVQSIHVVPASVRAFTRRSASGRAAACTSRPSGKRHPACADRSR